MKERFLAFEGYDMPVKTLSEAIRSVGEPESEGEYGFIRGVYHQSLPTITEDNITEKMFSDTIVGIVFNEIPIGLRKKGGC